MEHPEIDEGAEYIGFKDARDLIMSHTNPSQFENRPVLACAGYVSAEKVIALVDSPTNDISLKDGFAVQAQDVRNASPQHPVTLKIVGSVFAGGIFSGKITQGQAVKICSGSPVPAGTEAIVSSEFCAETASEVNIRANAGVGMNIFYAGGDVKAGNTVLGKERTLLPAQLGLIAAGGVSELKVYRKPIVALIAIGDEVIAPGQKLKEGQLYASNLINIGAWLSCYGIQFRTAVTVDNEKNIQQKLRELSAEADAVITSGGAWGSERDLIVKVLDDLGWHRWFRHVRMGPGKGIAFGVWQDKPVFCLPGGPPSNEMAFLQLALPGILHMAGLTGSPLITVPARLTQNVKGRHQAWTEFKKAKIDIDAGGVYTATPYFETSRLKSMADAACLICKPEGVEFLKSGQIVTIQVMVPTFAGTLIEDLIPGNRQ